MGLWNTVLDLLFPPKCAFCGKLLKSGEEGVCAVCLAELPYTTKSSGTVRGDFFTVCVAPLYYRDVVRRGLLEYKFRGARGRVKAYAPFLADCIRDRLDGRFDVLSWVPISAKRMRKRGYDQTKLLAEAAAQLLDLEPVCTLRKVRDAAPQSSLKGKEKRAANILDAYAAVSPESFRDLRVLLVDDIVTTGATLSECSRTLLMAGAESVVCAALAIAE